MNANFLLPLFPLLPVTGIIIIAFSKYIIKKDITGIVVPAFTLIQIAAGGVIIASGPEINTVINISSLPASIEFSFSPERIWMLAALLIPAFFSVFKIRTIKSESLRTVFLFYLAACSGVVITADLFNFFVFYELMIMSAYILISVQGKVYASIKYMFIGAVSAVFFLTGIIFVYASGLSFSFSNIADFSGIPPQNALLIISFFFTAFCIKSALFPASAWLPTCHSAGNGTISSFLSSFTVVSGYFGMYYCVILPAVSIGNTEVLVLLKIISLVSMCISSIFIFFDTDIKRTIAGSTVFISGFIGYLFASGRTETAWLYIFVHAVYKSILFHSTDNLEKQPLIIKGRLPTLLTIAVTVLFAGGIFPSIPHFIKKGINFHSTVQYVILYGSITFLLAGFFKFNIIVRTRGDSALHFRPKKRYEIYIFILAPLLLLGLYLLFFLSASPVNLAALKSGTDIGTGKIVMYFLEGGALAAAVLLGRIIFPRVIGLANIDSRFIFRNLTIELFALIILFAVVFIQLNIYPILTGYF